MNIKTVALTKEEFKSYITAIANGFTTKDGYVFKPNERMATILTIQGNVGMRIGDILNLTLQSFVKDGNRYRLDVVEEKTHKKREYTVAEPIYTYLLEYAARNNIAPNRRLFSVSVRAVQKTVAITSKYLGMSHVSTHSFRKFFATEIYNNNDCNIVLVQQLLQHCNPIITQRYIGIQNKQIEEALAKHVCIVV